MALEVAAPIPSPSLRGFCSPPALAELIRDLYLDERNGTLVLGRSGVEKQVRLDRGMILGVTSSLDDERLVPFLVQRGALRPEQAETLKGLDDDQCAQVLLQSGRLSEEQLGKAGLELAQQVLTGVFRWESLEYRFEEGPASAGPSTTNVVISFELIIRALRSMAGFDPIREALQRQDRALRLSEQLYLPFDQLSLTPVEGFLVSRIDGQARIRDIMSQVPPAEEEPAARFVFGLLILGLVQFVPPVASGPLSCADLLRGEEEKRKREERESAEIQGFYQKAREGTPAEVLGIGNEATPAQIKATYHSLKERFAPSRFLKKVQADLREELQIIEARLVEAYVAVGAEKLGAARPTGSGGDRMVNLNLEQLALRKELSKTARQSDEEEHTRLAEQFQAKARDYWKIGDYFNCIRYCEFATSHSDKIAGVYSLLGQALSRNPDYRWQKRAEGALVRAAELEPFSPGHAVALGDFYRSHGLIAKARKHYEKAVELLPSHPQALEALKNLPQIKD